MDQLRRRKTRPSAEVGEVSLHGARPDAHELGGVLDGAASGDVAGEDVHLALRHLGRAGAAQVPVLHRDWLTLGSLGCA
jgi:hypothetical protein